ncbi:hypothetical protein [Leptothoe sp. PORK10 BA2]|uniref:hypothetical protein n=1 Tax=Leptothoe sp. PORK10 BA2 TaxID=3110254 RepID=UPI002B1FD7C7|nr:hypothetical protein [Leptothoe sp. PORK10 BA2]MEA5466758.1 hypothetical protein [Leptothoe sp. PORK10 BA2]
MAASWKLPLDRAVRYAVSDALASVKSHVYDLEYTQRRSPKEVTTWNNYLAELRALHQLLLNLPSLEKAQWLTEEDTNNAPTFTPFVSGISDAKTNIHRVHSWLLSLSQVAKTGTSAMVESSDLMEQEYYTRQVNHALTQLQALPVPGSKAWQTRYQPSADVTPSRAVPPLVRAVA